MYILKHYLKHLINLRKQIKEIRKNFRESLFFVGGGGRVRYNDRACPKFKHLNPINQTQVI